MMHEPAQPEALAEFSELDPTEQLITRLPIRRPSATMGDRVALALAQAEDDPPVSHPLPWVRRVWASAAVILLGVAVGVTALVVLGGSEDTTRTGTPARPAGGLSGADLALGDMPGSDDLTRIEQVWISTEPTGQVVRTGDAVMEAVRVTAMREVSFEDEDGVLYHIAMPVEQFVYVPASSQ